MPWEALDHTADAGVVVTAEDRAGLFGEAVRALTDCITDVGRVRPRRARAVGVVADDLELLLVEWLGEALYLFEVEGFLAAGARMAIIDEGAAGLRLSGELLGEAHDPERHPHKVAIKAITYHGLAVERIADGWRARVIFDI
jgi:SHS2 domain-containing protein